MKCPKCGIENPQDAQYCFKCGAIMKIDNSNNSFLNSKIGKIIVLILIVSVLCGGVITYSISTTIMHDIKLANNNTTNNTAKDLNNNTNNQTNKTIEYIILSTYDNGIYNISYPSNGSYSESEYVVTFYNNNGEEMGYVLDDFTPVSNLNEFVAQISEDYTINSAEETTINSKKAFKIECTYQDGNEEIEYTFPNTPILLDVHKNVSNSDILVKYFNLNEIENYQ